MSTFKWGEKKESNGMEETPAEEFERKQKSRERRERLNGVEPSCDPYCNCGAKFDRGFPNIHSHWCNAYRKP